MNDCFNSELLVVSIINNQYNKKCHYLFFECLFENTNRCRDGEMNSFRESSLLHSIACHSRMLHLWHHYCNLAGLFKIFVKFRREQYSLLFYNQAFGLRRWPS